MTDSNMSELWPLFWDAAWETLYIVAITLTLGGLLGLLLGLGLYVTRGGGLYASRPVNLVLNVLVNFFRPIPFVIFIAAVQPFAPSKPTTTRNERRRVARPDVNIGPPRAGVQGWGYLGTNAPLS